MEFSKRTGYPICGCGRGYASTFDNSCCRCRGMTGWEAHLKLEKEKARLAKLPAAGKPLTMEGEMKWRT